MNSAETISVPTTEGIKYAGSKLRMLPHILSIAGKTGCQSVFDGFSGSTRVSQAFAQAGRRVISNDQAPWSNVLATCYLKGENRPGYYRDMIDHLNSLPGKDGWFTEHYGGDADQRQSGETERKMPFQVHNMRKLDAIRPEIGRMGLSHTDKCVLLASLILALDKVDSTLGHFASYLREWSPRSYNVIHLKEPLINSSSAEHMVLNEDVFAAAAKASADLSYFDPPYGSNNAKMPPSRVRYNAYYHFWKTVVLNDRPKTFGKAHRRTDSADTVSGSVFEDFRRGDDGEFVAVSAIRRLISAARSRFVLLSYSSGGRATRDALERVLTESGRLLEATEIDHTKNVMASMHWTGRWKSKDPAPHREYLFLIEK